MVRHESEATSDCSDHWVGGEMAVWGQAGGLWVQMRKTELCACILGSMGRESAQAVDSLVLGKERAIVLGSCSDHLLTAESGGTLSAQ